MAERLQKVMARHGVGSRRHCETLISAGRVTVDGYPASLGQQVESTAVIHVDGQPLSEAGPRLYVVLNKPPGCVTTVSDPQGRPTVMQFVSHLGQRIFPVGRLDYESEGLLLLTNDGELAYRLTHPGHEVVKQYEVDVQGSLTAAALDALSQGLWLDDGRTAPAEVHVLQRGHASMRLRIGIHEGRNRQVRRMIAAVGGQVNRLVRTAIGPLRLAGLGPGQVRRLSASEIEGLRGA